MVMLEELSGSIGCFLCAEKSHRYFYRDYFVGSVPGGGRVRGQASVRCMVVTDPLDRRSEASDAGVYLSMNLNCIFILTQQNVKGIYYLKGNLKFKLFV